MKGEESKPASTKPGFFTIQAGRTFEANGIRIVQNNLEDGGGNALGAQEVGTALEQRYYVPLETANIDIEFVIIPGY